MLKIWIIKKIKIGHIYVWDRQNKGDIAIVKAVQDLLISQITVPLEIEDFPLEIFEKRQNYRKRFMLRKNDIFDSQLKFLSKIDKLIKEL